MSYDLLVFSPEAAPTTQPAFLVWYETQTEWAEEPTYNDPALTTPALQAWLVEMEQTFPNLNGPNATDDHVSTYETDYCIGRVVIYAAFNWSRTEEAYATALRLAQKHQVGFYDPSFEGPILLPEDGKLRPMAAGGKQNLAWKKLWWPWW